MKKFIKVFAITWAIGLCTLPQHLNAVGSFFRLSHQVQSLMRGLSQRLPSRSVAASRLRLQKNTRSLFTSASFKKFQPFSVVRAFSGLVATTYALGMTAFAHDKLFEIAEDGVYTKPPTLFIQPIDPSATIEIAGNWLNYVKRDNGIVITLPMYDAGEHAVQLIYHVAQRGVGQPIMMLDIFGNKAKWRGSDAVTLTPILEQDMLIRASNQSALCVSVDGPLVKLQPKGIGYFASIGNLLSVTTFPIKRRVFPPH